MGSGGTAPPARVRIGLLGPTLITVGHEAIALSRLQARQLVGLLAGRPTTWSADELVEQLWASRPPAEPIKALRVVASRLRSVLGDQASCIESVGDGYRLVGVLTDLAEFDAAVGAARRSSDPSDIDRHLADALALCRGAPFADCLGPELFDRLGQQWAQQRLTAVALRLDALLRLGRLDELVGLGAPELDSAPDDERLALPVARALAASGRKLAALDVLQRARQTLLDAGLDSSGALAATEHEILTGATELHGDSRPHPGSRDRATQLVGREEVLDALLRAVGSPGASLVTGEPGAGKSTVLSAFTERRRAAGLAVVTLDASETPDRPMDTVYRVLAMLDPLEAPALPAGRGRDALIDAAAAQLAELAPATAHTLVIDDAQWLDDLSADVLATERVRSVCRLVYGSWPAALSDRPLPWADHHEPLGPLAADDISEFVASLTDGRHAQRESERIHHLSGGNPLFARLLVDLVREGHPLDQLPANILVAVQQRLDSLRQRSVSVLQAAAALGSEFPLRWLRLLAPHADAALNEAREAGLVAVNDLADEGRFLHGLVASSILQLTPAARLLDLHDRIGRHIHSAGGQPTQYALHFEHAAEIDPLRAVMALHNCAGRFAAGDAWDLAADHARRAMAVGDAHHLDESELLPVRLILGTALRQLGMPESSDHLFRAAVDALGLGNHDLTARAVIELCSHGATLRAGATHPHVRKLLLTSLDLELRADRRAELCAAASAVLSLSDDHALLRGLFHEAVDLAARNGDAAVQRRVLAHAHIGFAHPDDFERRSGAAQALRAASEGDLESVWEASFLEATTAMVLHRTDAFSDALAELREVTPRITRRPRRFGLAFTEAAWALYRGDLDDAEARCEAALHVGLELYPPEWVFGLYGSLLLALRDGQGRLGEMQQMAPALLKEAPDFAVWHLIATIGAVHSGDTAAAKRHWATVRADGFGSLPRDITWTASCGYAARMAVALGDERSAGTLLDLLTPYAGRMAWSGTCVYWPIDTAIAEVQEFLGDHDAAADTRAAAADLLTR